MVTKRNDKGMVVMGEKMKRQSLVHGERTHLVKFSLEKGSIMPLHNHPHEQTGYLLTGNMRLTINGQDYDLEPGDSWCIGPNVSHEAAVREDATVLEVFSPLRKDYL